MKIIPVSQDNIKEFLDARRATIRGSNAKATEPPARKGGESAGFWQLVGEMLTIPRDIEEVPMRRGHRLENEAIDKLSKKLGIEFNKDPQMWQSDTDEAQQISPDGAEPGNSPTYAAEVKNLTEGKHFKYLYKSRGFEGNPIDLVPDELGAFYKHQAIQYFVVNENLETLYFTLHCPDAAYEEHELVVITIKRNDVQGLVTAQDRLQKSTLIKARNIVHELVSDIKVSQTIK